MKKLSGLIIFLFCALYAFPQYPNNQSISNNQTRYHIPVLKTDSSTILPIKDTLNNQSTFYPGALTIRPQDTIGHAIFPIYQSNGRYWSRVSSAFIVSNFVDSVTLYNGLLCQWIKDTATCWFLTPATGGDVDSFHLNFDSLYILQYRNGALIDSIFLLHTYLYVTPAHLHLTPNYLGSPYNELLDVNNLIDSTWVTFPDSLYEVKQYVDGHLDSTQWIGDGGSGGGGGSGITALTGDVTASGSGSVAATLATVNGNVGSFTKSSITVNAKGLITAASSGTPEWVVSGNNIYNNNSGNVGIGNITPAQKLDVNGNINIIADSAYMYNGVKVITANITKNNFFYGGGNLTMTGTENVAMGRYALNANTTGINNFANGYASLFNNTTGTNNTASGIYSLFTNTIGISNAAYGSSALFSNTNGSGNVAIGKDALYFNTTGSHNIAIGFEPLWLNTTAYENVAIGFDAMKNNTTNSHNVALGPHSGYELVTATTDSGYNTMIGNGTARNITTGINNTIIGARVSGLAASLSNNIILADGWGKIGLQIDATGNTTLSGTVTATQYNVTSTLFWKTGTGSPESVVTAVVGSIFTRTDGGANTTLYIKESGSGNTGWIPK